MSSSDPLRYMPAGHHAFFLDPPPDNPRQHVFECQECEAPASVFTARCRCTGEPQPNAVCHGRCVNKAARDGFLYDYDYYCYGCVDPFSIECYADTLYEKTSEGWVIWEPYLEVADDAEFCMQYFEQPDGPEKTR